MRAARATDVVVGLAVVLLLGLAPAARITAEALPRPAEPVIELAEAAPASDGPVVRELPAGLPEGVTAQTPESLRALVTAALGELEADRLLDLLVGADLYELVGSNPGRRSNGDAAYPYAYPPIIRVLDHAPAAGFAEYGAQLGAALVLLASRRDPDGQVTYPTAGPAAFAVLHRASASGGCDVQLNLLLVVSADTLPRDGVVAAQAERAAAACPDDPTPGWVLGQFQSLRAQQVDVPDLPGSVPADAPERARATFEELVARFPDSPDALAGAADAHVREGSRIAEAQPFTARHEFGVAVDLYRRAAAAAPSAELVAGLARALAGLGEHAEAAQLLQDSEGIASAGYRLELLLHAQEAAHDFAAAANTARRLADLGEDGYPHGTALLATPAGGTSFEGDDMNIPAVSVGLDRFAPLTVTLQIVEGGGGAVVDDVSYIPAYRDDVGYVGTMAACPEWAWRRDAVLAGHSEAALAGLPGGMDFPAVRPGGCWRAGNLDRSTRDLLRLEAGERLDLPPARLDEVYDHRQNLWRWAGDLPRAADVVEEWLAAAAADAALPMLRLGEVRFLQGRYDDAAAAFGAATRRTRRTQWNEDLVAWQTELARGAALLRADRTDEGLRLLERVAADAERGAAYQDQGDFDYDYSDQFGVVAYHARALLADTQREDGAVAAALDSYAAAHEMLDYLEDSFSFSISWLRPERLDGNQAVAELAAGREEEAEASASRALAADPMNPAFLMTAGFVADRRGQLDTAIDRNRRALLSDPGAFPAANDLAVQLGRAGRDEEAATVLRQAVAAEPGYALGWFNLGVVHARLGPRHLLASQGAIARAVELDPDFADRKHVLTIDATIYRTGLDLSKPLPPRWSLADRERLAPTASVGLLAVLLLGVGLARSSRRDGAEIVSRWADTVTQLLSRGPMAARLRAPAWGLAVTLLLLLVPLVRQDPARVWELVAAGLGILVLAVAAVRARVLVDRIARPDARPSVGQESWPPGMVLGVVTTAAGAPWAPLPVVASGDAGRGTHAAAPLTLAALSALLLLEAAWLEVPLARSLGIAALIMTASTLLPVPPLDGAKLAATGLVAGVGLVGAALLTVLGLG